MKTSSSLTIIDDKNIRGVLAPANVLSQELLEGLVDFIELSSGEARRSTESRVKTADRANSWIPAQEVERKLKKRLTASK